MFPLELTPMLTIPAGETLHLRVLPWHEHSSGSGKYILLRDVKIEGQAFEPGEGSAVEATEAAVKAVKVLRNGQLFIIKNGVAYNVLGAIVR